MRVLTVFGIVSLVLLFTISGERPLMQVFLSAHGFLPVEMKLHPFAGMVRIGSLESWQLKLRVPSK
ncbi:hypothetical protein ES708_06287 [subsurface metagenome]